MGCTKLKGKMTLQKNSSNATKRKRKFQEQSENHSGTISSSSTTSNRQQMNIQTEFQILQSLIPGIANQDDISELEILDACVEYIESLQDQLDLHCQKKDGSKIPRMSLLVTARSNFFVKRDGNLRHNIRMR